MTVKELIKELEKYDWKMKVYVYDREDQTYDDSFEFKQQVESFMIWEDWKPIASRIDKDYAFAKQSTKERKKVVHKDILVIYADY